MLVLIVDDELEIREGLKANFPWETYGIGEVLVADDGETALPIAREKRPELILTDIKMKRMSGLEFLQTLNEERAHEWKSIVISGYDDFDMVRQAMKLGAVDYILKPINMSELGDILRQAMAQLDRERMERQNRQMLNSQIRDAYPKIREELLKELLESGYDPYRETRIVHRLQTLQLDWMTRERMAVMVIEVDDLKAIENRKGARNEKELILFGIGNVVKQTMEEDYPSPSALYQDARNRWVAVMACQDDAQLESCKELAQVCIRRINEFVKVNVSIGLGSATGYANQLHARFLETSDILEQKAVYGGNRLLTSQGWEEDAEHGNSPVQNPDEVLDLVRYGTDGDIEEAMDKFMDLVQTWSLTQIKDIQQKTFGWLLDIFKRAAALGWQDKIWQKNPIAVWEQLEQYDTIDSLRRQIERFLMAIARDFREQASSPSQIIQEADKFIHKRYIDGLTLQSVAAEVHVTPVWLSKLYKKEKRKTFLEYLTEVRMEQAKKMLGDVQYKIYQVSALVGYKDPVHFTKLFKKQTGCTPKEYRNRMGIADE
ncbi:response regulator transcription factor [Cohnella silvisoli]|uniref:Response regulator n=1 Tax=Cohnella silvisoli TaxID=2873699 RepID=A0ABV1KPF9_9BACL|nr:response regulator [Cohnella silvisoli]MCD9025587.1 response regulator [Cohnella silvisoli]